MLEEKYNNLVTEVDDLQKRYEKKRKFYDDRVRFCNITLSLLPPITAGLILTSFFWEDIEVWLKICSFVCCLVSIGINHTAKSQNYGSKLIQRGTTYFALCDLARKMRLEIESENKYEEFAKEFQKIMENDNKMSLSNSLAEVELLNQNYAKGVEQEEQLKARQVNHHTY